MVVFLYFLVMKPEFLLIPNYMSYQNKQIKERFRKSKVQSTLKKTKPKGSAGKTRFLSPEAELNFLLDKVQKEGFENLTASEKDRLEQLSRDIDWDIFLIAKSDQS